VKRKRKVVKCIKCIECVPEKERPFDKTCIELGCEYHEPQSRPARGKRGGNTT
jgi:hypothetical protein